MMIAELIDQDDFVLWLVEQGAPVAAGSSSDQCVAEIKAWLQSRSEPQRVSFHQALTAFADKRNIMLPEVQSAVNALLEGGAF